VKFVDCAEFYCAVERSILREDASVPPFSWSCHTFCYAERAHLDGRRLNCNFHNDAVFGSHLPVMMARLACGPTSAVSSALQLSTSPTGADSRDKTWRLRCSDLKNDLRQNRQIWRLFGGLLSARGSSASLTGEVDDSMRRFPVIAAGKMGEILSRAPSTVVRTTHFL
jgi:hypothetical protein